MELVTSRGGWFIGDGVILSYTRLWQISFAESHKVEEVFIKGKIVIHLNVA